MKKGVPHEGLVVGRGLKEEETRANLGNGLNLRRVRRKPHASSERS